MHWSDDDKPWLIYNGILVAVDVAMKKTMHSV